MLINTRILQASLTGVQRYLNEVLDAWPEELPELIAPPVYASRGLKAHIWEQLVLPLQLRKQLLWSPVHSGPFQYANQIVTVHDVVPLDHPEWLNPNFARWYRFMLPKLLHKAHHVIAISEFTKQRIMANIGLSEDQISVIPNGVGSQFQPVPLQQTIKMREHFKLSDRSYVLSVCSLEPRKNLIRLLKAWHQALPYLPEDLHLLVVGGSGDLSVFSSNGLNELPSRVIQLGRVDEEWLPSLYSAADFFVYVSLYEGFGLPPLEAMACGTPVLVSDIPVMNEVVGQAAIKALPYDVNSIASAIRSLANDPGLRQNLGCDALIQSEKFSWENTALQTCTLLNRYE